MCEKICENNSRNIKNLFYMGGILLLIQNSFLYFFPLTSYIGYSQYPINFTGFIFNIFLPVCFLGFYLILKNKKIIFVSLNEYLFRKFNFLNYFILLTTYLYFLFFSPYNFDIYEYSNYVYQNNLSNFDINSFFWFFSFFVFSPLLYFKKNKINFFHLIPAVGIVVLNSFILGQKIYLAIFLLLILLNFHSIKNFIILIFLTIILLFFSIHLRAVDSDNVYNYRINKFIINQTSDSNYFDLISATLYPYFLGQSQAASIYFDESRDKHKKVNNFFMLQPHLLKSKNSDTYGNFIELNNRIKNQYKFNFTTDKINHYPGSMAVVFAASGFYGISIFIILHFFLVMHFYRKRNIMNHHIYIIFLYLCLSFFNFPFRIIEFLLFLSTIFFIELVFIFGLKKSEYGDKS